ncbi:Crocetin glucosyltransferase, chloroplastic [Sesamum angolense]|uniref:Crocetin glucosyltransferase, chloroplastic n=1 Tax=Sesamum angolense TaxID=2727404 RepID=A0AAE2C031_9LAMI|nr:Crocetin glucosyltransferase, chloroplastic [Sesamum angolense]
MMMGFTMSDDPNKYMTEIRSRGAKTLKDTALSAAEQGRPVTCLIYTPSYRGRQRWRVMSTSRALLWIQPATVLDIYYYYFNGFADEIIASSNDPSWKLQLPGLPILLSERDLPSFTLPNSSERYSFALASFKEQLEALDVETKPKVLVNTFDSLESDALKAIDKYELIGVGPLIPSAFLDGKDPSDTSFGGDLFQKSDDYIEWLNSKPESSVVYVSFGSLLRLPKAQMEEIAKGLLDSSRPFLWLYERTKKPMRRRKKRMRGTNAKLIEDAWRTGVRVRANEAGVVESGEIRRCIEEVMDEGKSRELRQNAEKWKGLAREGMEENGSSNKNLKAFFDEVGGGF